MNGVDLCLIKVPRNHDIKAPVPGWPKRLFETGPAKLEVTYPTRLGGITVGNCR